MPGKVGAKPQEDFTINGQSVDEPGSSVTLHGVTHPIGVLGLDKNTQVFAGGNYAALAEAMNAVQRFPQIVVSHQRHSMAASALHGDPAFDALRPSATRPV